MKYIKIYEDMEDQDLVDEEMNALFLKNMIEALHKDGFKTARTNSKNSKVIEAEAKEAVEAKEYVKEYLDIILGITGADLNATFTTEEKIKYFDYLKKGERRSDIKNKNVIINDKLDLLKLFFITILYIFGGLFFVLSKMQGSQWEENWWYIIVFLTPAFTLRFLAPTLRMLNTPFPMAPQDEAWMQSGKKITKTLTWFFWIIAIPMIYLFFRANEFQWNLVISGNKETIFELLNFLAPVIFIGSSAYLLKLAFHRKVYLNPTEFSEEEIEEMKLRKEEAIAESKK